MTMLHYLELNDNRLIGQIPPELGKLIDLFDINVYGNCLNGTISPAFERLESLIYLSQLQGAGLDCEKADLDISELPETTPLEVWRSSLIQVIMQGSDSADGFRSICGRFARRLDHIADLRAALVCSSMMRCCTRR